ncbi:FtsK/SpoIIIE domain-containing protein [Arsenicicoccus sp. oral taxon 190]|uniref:FtsK/SpoIIIE domain-containing protein n=1 Tax=Arsenicicoccus sp. oral taxon 190 TaxID=1658671 RepID=UPI00067A02EC|nr:FtsK/SpoIIIE domain-containing protein [Arsenicicoccus sp. oral taxon 190]AKT51447.1 hypothetical protein ADJ73_09190 [Arsenicicoccus sp. oral taxon 190]
MRLDLVLRRSGNDALVTITCAPGTPWVLVRDELCAEQALPAGAVCRIDGRRLPDDAVVGVPPLLRGAVVTTDGATAPAAPSPLLLAVLGGPAAGLVLPLASGHLALGRHPDCDLTIPDPALSRHHAVLSVDDAGVALVDAGSTNGSEVDDEVAQGPRALTVGVPLRLGRSTVAVVRAPRTRPVEPDGEGRLGVRPAPAPRRVVEQTTLERPRPPAPDGPRPFPWLTLALPLLAAGVLAAVVRAPYLLAFGLLGPVMVLATFLTDRRARRRSHSRDAEQHREALRELDRAVEQAARRELATLEARTLDPASALLVARSRGPRLWQPSAPDGSLPLRLGRADIPSHVLVRSCGPEGDGVEGVALRNAPVELDLAAAGSLGVGGPGAGRAVSAALGSLAAGMPPGTIRLHVLCPSERGCRRWSWVRWLPHAGPPMVIGSSDAEALCARLVGTAGDPPAGPGLGAPEATTAREIVVVTDADHPAAGALVRRLAPSPAQRGGPLVVAVSEREDGVPATVGAWMRLAPDGTATVGRPDGTMHTAVVPDLAADGWTSEIAGHLAPLTSAAPAAGWSPPPDRVVLSDVSPLDLSDPDGIRAAWQAPTRGPVAPLGHTGSGPVLLDLVADGPHVLVGGTTGSGKSELLQTLVAGLALALPPDELTFLLVDYKGGAAFAECSELPHTCGLITDLDPHLARRALASLRAELTYRERVLRDAGAADLAAYDHRRGPHDPPLPRLVIVIDEFRMLAAELPEFVTGVLAVAAVGRSLGVHLVLATQRPAGVVTADIRANVNARIALRMRDRADSEDVLEAPDAARISDRAPGRALWRAGDQGLQTFQTAWAGAPAPTGAVPPVLVEVDGRPTVSPAPGPDADRPTELSVLVRSVRTAAAGRPTPRSPWLPPLPDQVVAADLPVSSSTRIPLGLADLPDQQSRAVHVLDLAAGRHLAVVGTHRTGRTTALRALATAAAATPGVAEQLHVHVVDGGNSLDDLPLLPHCGTRVTRDDPQRTVQLLRRLAASCHDRAPDAPRVLLLVDRWDAVLAGADPLLAATLQDAMVALLRDGPAGGLVTAIAGDRSLLTSSLAAHLGERLVLQLTDAADLALCGIPAQARPDHQPPGRALRSGDHAEVQLVQAQRVTPALAATLAPPARPPLRLVPLPARADLDELSRACPGAVGLGGDEATPVRMPLPSPGVVAVLGPPGSGRSTALAVLARAHLDRPAEPGTASAQPPTAPAERLVVVTPGRSPLADWAREAGATVAGPHDADLLRAHLDRHPGAVLLVDGVDLLVDSPVEAVCVEAARRATAVVGRLRGSNPPQPVVVAAGTTAQLATTYRGLPAELRRATTGIVLQPRHASDGDLLGVPVPRLHNPPPGRGVLVHAGRTLVVQVGHLDLAPRGGPPAHLGPTAGTIVG